MKRRRRRTRRRSFCLDASPMTKLAATLAALLHPWRIAKSLPPTRHPRRIVELPKLLEAADRQQPS
jgi:hypothetical protein